MVCYEKQARGGGGCAGHPGQGRWTGKEQLIGLETGASKLEAKHGLCWHAYQAQLHIHDRRV